MAQHKVGSLSTPHRLVYESQGLSGQDGSFSLFFCHKESRNFYVFSQAGEVISSLSYPFPSRETSGNPLGIRETPEAYHYFFESLTHRNSLEVTSLSKQKGKPKVSLLPLSTNPKEKYLQTIADQGQLFFMLINRSENKLVLVEAVNGQELERHVFELDRQLLWAIRKAHFQEVYQEKSNLFGSLQKEKVYLRPNRQLVLSLELDRWQGRKAWGLSGLLELDLQQGKARFRLLPAAVKIDKKFKANSLLFQDKFFKLAFSKDFFQLYIYSYPALEKLKSYHYRKEEAIGLMEESFTAHTSHLADGSPAAYDTRQVLKKLWKGEAELVVNSYNGETLCLQLGTYGKHKGGGGLIPLERRSLNTPDGNPNLPLTYNYYAFPGKANSFEYSFQTTLNRHSLEPVAEQPQPELLEKEEQVIENLEMGRNDRLVYFPVSQRKSMLAHFDSRERLFTFYLISSGSSYELSFGKPEELNGF